MNWLWKPATVNLHDTIKRINTMLVVFGVEIDNIELEPYKISPTEFWHHYVHINGFPIIPKMKDLEPGINFDHYNNVVAYHRPTFLGETNLWPQAGIKYTLNF